MSILISKVLTMARVTVNEGLHNLPATHTVHTYPRIERVILPLIPSRSASPHFGRYSFPVPQRVADGGNEGHSENDIYTQFIEQPCTEIIRKLYILLIVLHFIAFFILLPCHSEESFFVYNYVRVSKYPSFHLFLVYGDEICRRKPLVTSYVVDAILEVTKTFREIHLKKIAQQILELATEM